ncbi:MAG: hypothetical protein ACD_58C00068G0001, partial [uncultured bacterium]
AELVYAHGLGPCGIKPVEVRVLSPAPANLVRGTLDLGSSAARRESSTLSRATKSIGMG